MMLWSSADAQLHGQCSAQRLPPGLREELMPQLAQQPPPRLHVTSQLVLEQVQAPVWKEMRNLGGLSQQKKLLPLPGDLAQFM